MLQPIRRILAATGVAVALLMAVPAPSWAAQEARPAQGYSLSLLAQAWSWLESLLSDSRTPGAQRKDVVTTPLPPPPPPDQGPMIDPNGVK